MLFSFDLRKVELVNLFRSGDIRPFRRALISANLDQTAQKQIKTRGITHAEFNGDVHFLFQTI